MSRFTASYTVAIENATSDHTCVFMASGRRPLNNNVTTANSEVPRVQPYMRSVDLTPLCSTRLSGSTTLISSATAHRIHVVHKDGVGWLSIFSSMREWLMVQLASRAT